MTPLQLKKLPAEDQRIGILIMRVIKSAKFWWLVQQLDLYDDAFQELYLHVMIRQRDKLIGHDDRYIVGALQNFLRDLLRKRSNHGFCSEGGGVPSQDLRYTVVDADKSFMDKDGDMDAYDQIEATWQPEPYEVLEAEAHAEAEYELLDNEIFQRLSLACSATSLSSSAAIIGSNKRDVEKCAQADFEKLRDAIPVRLGRYAR